MTELIRISRRSQKYFQQWNKFFLRVKYVTTLYMWRLSEFNNMYEFFLEFS
jgi:hypothetical protein